MYVNAVYECEREETMQRGVITYPVVVGVRLPADQAERIRRIAEADDRPASSLLRRIIAKGLDQYEQQGVTGVR